MWVKFRYARYVVCLTIVGLSTVGCAGGGGTPQQPGTITPSPTPVGPDDPNYYRTSEFYSQRGLSFARAEYAYAEGVTGNGVTVAVIDNGVDLNHSEFSGRISSSSTWLYNNCINCTSGNNHGTHVAGLIGAAKDGRGMHGIAYQSTILAIDVDVPVQQLDGSWKSTYEQTGVGNAIIYAVDNGAQVINISLGGQVPWGVFLENALIYAANNGVIVAASTGNDSNRPWTSAPATFPARYAGEPLSLGLLLAVGSHGSDGVSDFSNRCDVADMHYCLLAAGSGMNFGSIYSTVPGGGYGTISGTSMATPQVSGALALLIDAFPQLTPQQIVERLLTNAFDMGVAGDDIDTGSGQLDLKSIFDPIGTLSIKSPSGKIVPLSESSSSLSPMFTGIDVLGTEDLSIVAFDEQDAPYLLPIGDLNQPLAQEKRFLSMVSPGVERLHSTATIGDAGWLSIGMTRDLSFHHSNRQDISSIADSLAPIDLRKRQLDPDFSLLLSNQIGPVSFNAGLRERAVSKTIGTIAHSRIGYELEAQNFLIGQRVLYSFAASAPIFSNTDIALNFANSKISVNSIEANGVKEGLESARQIAFASSDYSSINNLDVILTSRLPSWQAVIQSEIGVQEESQSILGSSTTGILGTIDGAKTYTFKLRSQKNLSANLMLFAGGAYGVTSSETLDSQLGIEWRNLNSSGWHFGVQRIGLATHDDRFTITLGSPVSVETGQAVFHGPIGISGDAMNPEVHWGERNLDLKKRSRVVEISSEYGMNLGRSSSLNFLGYLREQNFGGGRSSIDLGFGIRLQSEM